MAELPLTKLFKKVDNPYSSVEEALEACQANFTVEKRPVFTLNSSIEENGFSGIDVPGYCAIVKTSDDTPLSIMGDRYGVIQYSTALDFLNDLVGNKEVEIYGATTIDNGAKLHLIVKVPDYAELSPNEKFECYYIVSASHDGTGALQAMCSPIHSVSQTVFTPTGDGIVKIKHTANADVRVAKAKRMFNKLHSYFAEFGEAIKHMTNIQLSDEEAKTYFRGILPDKEGQNNTRVENVRNHMYDLYKNTGLCRNLASCKDTLFGCFMAVQQQVDYYKTVRKSIRRNEIDAKIEARLTGDGAKMKALAYTSALILIRKFS